MTLIQWMSITLVTVGIANGAAVGIYLTSEPAEATRIEVETTLDSPPAAPTSEDPENPNAAPANTGYSKTPYSEQYAVIACEQKTDDRYGAKLVQRYVNSLSTRYDNRAENFVVVLIAHVGSRENYNEMKIYCHIDPKTYAVSYFKDYPN